jgi:predicted phage-related endonuclease
LNNVEWPSLEALIVPPSEREARRSFIGGSDANIILSGDRAKVERLWREKRGEAEAEDLSGKLAVMLGCWSEPFNRLWFEKLSGSSVTRIAQTMVSADHDWRCCTLDGFVEASGAVFEAKHTSAFMTSDQVLERYMPQLQHNMAVTGTSRAILAVIFGNHKYEIIEVASDWLYQAELLNAEQAFWSCVLSGKEPVPCEPPPPPKPIGTREICFEGNNAWASAAVDWLEHRAAARTHAAAAGLIKSLIEEDVTRAFGHGIEARRSKAGAITIRELA